MRIVILDQYIDLIFLLFLPLYFIVARKKEEEMMAPLGEPLTHTTNTRKRKRTKLWQSKNLKCIFLQLVLCEQYNLCVLE